VAVEIFFEQKVCSDYKLTGRERERRESRTKIRNQTEETARDERKLISTTSSS